MKRFVLAIVAAVLCCGTMSAQDDKNFFNHVAVGVTAGTTGIGFDVAVPVGDYVQLRAGYAAFPKLKMDTDLDISEATGDLQAAGIPSQMTVEGKLNIGNAKILADLFPFKSSSFHFTVGAYIGSSKIVEVYNKNSGDLMSITNWNTQFPNNQIGLELGDYLLAPDSKGNVNACIKTAGFKPYVGLGFGRAVPKNRVGFMMELGAQIWGSPKVYCNDHELTSDDLGSDGGDIMKTMSKITIYPVLNFRICGRFL